MDLNEVHSNSTFYDSIKIMPLISKNLPDNFCFFKVLIQYPEFHDPFEYIFSYNNKNQTFYKIKGFYKNDYWLFFNDLRKEGIRINNNYLLKRDIFIPGINLACLVDAYRMKQDNILYDEVARRKFSCLTYNGEVVTVY